ncbi:succinylglutamate desuccinylase/aspartoacylase family protein [Neisseriaceae bacterium TC5R-5]|nr:succinylglutamate desuccinylase/aspartoacylase family protein [Neisseriaceae bacterium TC5R-5]
MHSNLPFISHNYTSHHDGPRLIITAAVHGNEICGIHAIRRIMTELEQGSLVLQRGSLTLVPITNPLAYKLGQRAGERNLNRNLSPTNTPQDFEDHIANWLCPLLAQHDVLLDLHSFQAPGQAFVFIGPPDNQGQLEPFAQATAEQELAKRLGVSRVVDGWLATYALGVERRRQQWPNPDERQAQLNTDTRYGIGTTEYMRQQGGWAVTLECGQHADPQAPEVAYRAIRHTLAHLQMIDAPPPAIVPTECLSLYEVTDKADDGDHFTRSWTSFDPVQKGELIGQRADGSPIVASDAGRIVFPNPRAQAGQEWFYLARESGRLTT